MSRSFLFLALLVLVGVVDRRVGTLFSSDEGSQPRPAQHGDGGGRAASNLHAKG